jgi:hypothetical protein
MQASTSTDGKLNLQLDSAEAEGLRRSVKIAVSAMVTLYARAGMRDAKDFFVKLDEALQPAPSVRGIEGPAQGGPREPHLPESHHGRRPPRPADVAACDPLSTPPARARFASATSAIGLCNQKQATVVRSTVVRWRTADVATKGCRGNNTVETTDE